MLVLHIALVLQHLRSGSQNEGGGVINAGNQIKVALTSHLFCIKLFPPVYEDARPEIDEEWPAAIKCLLESGFDKDINLRPKASLFDDIIRDELKKLRNGDTQILNDSWILRRRSLWSFTKMELPPEKKIMLMREAEEEDESHQLIEASN